MKHFFFASAIAISIFGSVGAAQAGTIIDNTDVTPGVFYGNGNVNGGFEVNNDGGVQIGLRAKNRFGAVPAPVNGNEYDFALGSAINVDYSATDPYVAFAGTTTRITITNLATNGFATFDPSLWPDNALANVGYGYQNSQPLSQAFFNTVQTLGFNPNINDTYKVDFTLSNFGGSGNHMEVVNFVKVGSGFAGAIGGAVPEPSSWALMIIGFGSAGVMLRRRKLATVLAR